MRKPDNPEKEGNEFLGWSKDGSEIVDFDQFISSWDFQPVTLYAVREHAWEWQSDRGSDADDSGNTDNNVNADEISTGAENVSISASDVF